MFVLRVIDDCKNRNSFENGNKSRNKNGNDGDLLIRDGKGSNDKDLLVGDRITRLIM